MPVQDDIENGGQGCHQNDHQIHHFKPATKKQLAVRRRGGGEEGGRRKGGGGEEREGRRKGGSGKEGEGIMCIPCSITA